MHTNHAALPRVLCGSHTLNALLRKQRFRLSQVPEVKGSFDYMPNLLLRIKRCGYHVVQLFFLHACEIDGMLTITRSNVCVFKGTPPSLHPDSFPSRLCLMWASGQEGAFAYILPKRKICQCLKSFKPLPPPQN